MANTKKTREKEERRERLYTAIQNHPGKSYSTADIMTMLSVGRECAKRDMQAVSEMSTDIFFGNNGIKYVLPNGGVSPDTLFLQNERAGMEKYSLNKNSEGYSDPTAAGAIKKVTREDHMNDTDNKDNNIKPEFIVGDVWTINSTDLYKEQEVIILAINKIEERITCCPYDSRKPRAHMNIFTKPMRCFKTRAAGLPLSKRLELKEKLGKYFGIEEKTVEKVVEKVIEVPVEPVADKAVEAEKSTDLYTKSEVDALLTEQKAQIYEECFKLLARGR